MTVFIVCWQAKVDKLGYTPDYEYTHGYIASFLAVQPSRYGFTLYNMFDKAFALSRRYADRF